MNLSTKRHTLKDAQRTATIVSLPISAPRRFRREDDAPRGQILLFTGVRYERIDDVEVEAAAPQRKLS